MNIPHKIYKINIKVESKAKMKFKILEPKRHDLQPRTHPNEAYRNEYASIYLSLQKSQIYYINHIDHIVCNS